MERKKKRRIKVRARPSRSDNLTTSPAAKASQISLDTIRQRVKGRAEDLMRRSGLDMPFVTKQHPLKTVLLFAYIKRQITLECGTGERERIERELVYLQSCLVPYQPSRDSLPEGSFLYQAALNLIDMPGRKPSHRPPTMRQRAIEALEQYLLDPKRWTWPLLARRLCPKKHEHDSLCKDSLYRTARNVYEELRRLGLKLPSVLK